ncbi:UNVERIFIED_CONTAM: hypothetical protein FKN15_052094 [Acipenser sinensis]
MLLSLGMLMLSATQIYTIFTVQLFTFLNLLPVDADIAAYSTDNKTQTFDDLPSRFGYRLPSEGLKVLNAQKAGYKAAIVHNVESEDLISMGSNDVDIVKQIDIPSVFIGEGTASFLKEGYFYEKGGHIVLLPDFSLPLEYYLIPFLIIVGICLILIVVFMGLNCLLFGALGLAFTTLSMTEGDVYDVCAICLDEYEGGDKLRVLPCSHAYHCKCVDPWLTKTKKTCPVCKQKVVPSQGDSDSDTDEADSSHEETDDVSESTPLLRSLASTSAHSFGTMSESRSRQEVLESSEYEDDDDPEIDSSEAEEEVSVETVVVQLQQSHRDGGTATKTHTNA